MIKSLHLFFIALVFALSAKSATITWDGGGGDGLWSTPANWVGDLVPVAADDVVLDNAVVTGNYLVVFPGGTYGIILNSFRITPIAGNTITFTIPVTNTADPAFSVTGPGDAIVLNSGAIFYNSSGRTIVAGGTAVTVSTTNFFRINNGARYIHNTSSGHTNNLVSRLSTAAGTENGIFEFDIPGAGSNTISLSNRTYGTLRFSSLASGGTVTYIGNGVNPLTINGDLQINSGATFSISLTATCIVKGNFTQQPGSIFNIQNSATAGANNIVRLMRNVVSAGTVTETGAYQPVIELGGTINQDISITGSILNSISFRINNPAGATLLAPLSLPYNLDLLNGKIRTNDPYMILLGDNATATGGSSFSFVEGPMKKRGDDALFIFPVGKGNIYAPISFNSPGLAITDEFQAEYFRLNPQNTFGTDYESPFDHVSYVEYWKLEKTAGAVNPVSVTLAITQYSFAEVLSSTYVARHNDGDNQWKNSGTSGRILASLVSPYVTGTVTGSPVTQLGVFTLATTDPFWINPLPVKVISFNAVRTNTGKVKLNWQLADNITGAGFGIERSIDGKKFSSISSIESVNGVSAYTALDNELFSGTKWYRLKVTDKAGTIFYSRTAVLTDLPARFIIAAIFPNPVYHNGSVNVYSSVNEKLKFVVSDVSGRIITETEKPVTSGINTIQFNAENFHSGIYFLYILGKDFKQALRFIKL